MVRKQQSADRIFIKNVEVHRLSTYPLQSCAMIITFTSNRKYKLKQLTWHKSFWFRKA
jgi:hypothetical protein